ncbi:putative Fungal-specific transcription factor domain-containing protein [Seiridium cardinale]|uniref:Fungal-specific transcription factor domain-containing protein n=1 Tax=Seiridium cardinale TaxID=138064 RepID=A0ABR2XNX1_9PEZI
MGVRLLLQTRGPMTYYQWMKLDGAVGLGLTGLIWEPSVSSSLAVSASSHSSHLLSLAHVKQRTYFPTYSSTSAAKPANMNEWYREAINLRHLVSSFTPALNHEFGIAGTGGFTLFPAVALCHSASLSLYSHHSCAESGDKHNHGIGTPEQLEMQTIALAGILRCCGEVAIPARQVTLVLENGSEMVEALRKMSEVWEVANDYLAILDGLGFQNGIDFPLLGWAIG